MSTVEGSSVVVGIVVVSTVEGSSLVVVSVGVVVSSLVVVAFTVLDLN